MVISMKRFIEGENRYQSTLFPERLDDYIAEDNAVRVVDAFVERLDLLELGFDGVIPQDTGRPSYHPAMMLKLYIYGYLNRIQSSRRLEREAQRNVELIWLTGRLMPAFKTIADFRKDNREAICTVCLEFIELCRELRLFSGVLVAIDGSKFKAVNSRDNNYTTGSVQRRLKNTQENIDRYLAKLDAVDAEEPEIREVTAKELNKKIASMEAKMAELKARQQEVAEHPDKQVSTTDPDCRSMTRPGGGSVVGYNVQTAVDEKHHLIVTHEVTNDTSDRAQLEPMGKQAKRVLDASTLTVVADAGYYEGQAIVDCYEDGIQALVPKMNTSSSKSKGKYSKADFRYDAERNEYVCPAGERLTYRRDSVEEGKTAVGVRALRLFVLRASPALYDSHLQAPQALGARRCSRQGPGQSQEVSRGDATAKGHRGAPLQYHQTADGIDALPDAAITERESRDEPSCTRLQHETGDQCAGNRQNHRRIAVRVKNRLLLSLPDGRETFFSHSLGQNQPLMSNYSGHFSDA